mgnify:CR=1 FL=1
MKCDECNELTEQSYYREKETETVCEDCWMEFLLEFHSTHFEEIKC